MNAAAVGISITAVVGVLGLIAYQGFSHFWPSDVQLIKFNDAQGQAHEVYAELVELDHISVQQFLESSGNAKWVKPDTQVLERWLLKTGNRRINPPDFRWMFLNQISSMAPQPNLLALERVEWGNAYGIPVGVTVNGIDTVLTEPAQLGALLIQRVSRAAVIRTDIDALESGSMNHISYRLERLRLQQRALQLSGDSNPQRSSEIEEEVADLREQYAHRNTELRNLYKLLDQDQLTLSTASGELFELKVADILHAWQPNDMSAWQKSAHYLGAIGRFLTKPPREANTEGGIFPAIFGTVLMVMLMSLFVTPFGVIAAVYLREYAKQGAFVRFIRIAVNNLAGVPSIVYGVFGLGFFVYFLGGNIDRLFFPESLPAPTFGTPGLMWASLTLALLTVPVVIVSTEEGLTRIPRSLREGSLALGATKAETLFKVILPMASPSILTGVILAVARAAGEVAPLMLVGVVKLAPTLPIDTNFPYLHLERKFMHLGFHIYDVGFQSPNVEAARPLVYATALLLIIIIVVLNLTAITLRGRLERRYRGVES